MRFIKEENKVFEEIIDISKYIKELHPLNISSMISALFVSKFDISKDNKLEHPENIPIKFFMLLTLKFDKLIEVRDEQSLNI